MFDSSTAVDRLSRDLTALRLLMAAGEFSDSQLGELLAVESIAAANIPKAQRCVDEHSTAAQMNSYLAEYVTRIETFGAIDVSASNWQIAATESSEGTTQFESLTRLHELLHRAIEAEEITPQEIKRLVALVIKGEKQLFNQLVADGVYVPFAQADAMVCDAITKVAEYAKSQIGDEEKFAAVVERVLEEMQ